MQERTFYVPMPVKEELPEKSGWFFVSDSNKYVGECLAYWFDAPTKRWMDGQDENHPQTWLKPVLVTEVPSEENRAEFAKQKLGDANMSMNFSHRFSFLLGMDSMLPQIALLKEENDRLKARVAELEGENKKSDQAITVLRRKIRDMEVGDEDDDWADSRRHPKY